MAIVIDFAWTKPTAAQAKADGAVACGMYASHDPSKNITAALASAYASVGIKSFTFFEDTANRALGGYNAGVADALFNYKLVRAAGQPLWAPSVPAADFDVPDFAPASTDPKAKLGPVGEYFRAWHNVNLSLGVIADAAYGDYYLIERLIAAGLCDIGVQTIAWSGGQVDSKDITLFQDGHMLNGGTVDVEQIYSSALLSHLAWTPGESNPVQPPPTVLTWAMWPRTLQLQEWNTGTAVKVLQTACANSGMVGVRGIGVDGVFGPQTLTAVRNFQAAENLGVDGIAGPQTHDALVALNDL